MKIKFLHPTKHEGCAGILIEKCVIKCNKRAMFAFSHKINMMSWKAISNPATQSIVVTGEYLKENYWCNEITFEQVFSAFPFLTKERKKFMKSGFNGQLIASILKSMDVMESLNKINRDEFVRYLKNEFGI